MGAEEDGGYHLPSHIPLSCQRFSVCFIFFIHHPYLQKNSL